VNEEILNPAKHSAEQSEGLTLSSRSSTFLAGLLDSLSFLFFCVSFSSVTHLLGSWWNRFSAK
jgi:hypothetical protein